MNGKTITAGVLVGIAALLVGMQYGQAASTTKDLGHGAVLHSGTFTVNDFEVATDKKTSASPVPAPATSTLKIGLVSVREAFNNSKKHREFQAQSNKRLAQVRTELDVLGKQLDSAEAELRLVKQGTDDYVKLYKTALELRAKAQNQQELFKQQQMADNRKWFEDLYHETLNAVKEVAQERGLDLVLERSEPSFPIANEDVLMTMGTHKVLYSNGCPDLTEAVTARIDASPTLRP
jgi:Skp family chaperone for outer membrane proteins